MKWNCAVCEKEIGEMVTLVKDEYGNMVRLTATPDLSNPNNPSNPASKYWSVSKDEVYCGAEHSLLRHKAS